MSEKISRSNATEVSKDMYVPEIAIALVHYPILDRQKDIVATNITNFDIHDIARAATVYGVKKYYIVHPMKEQQMFVERILDHWRCGQGSKFNPSRRQALGPVHTASTVAEALKDWNRPDSFVVATHARPVEGAKAVTFTDFRKQVFDERRPGFVVFGTGYGLTDDFMRSCDGVLESLRGAPPQDFRHLSVRSAVSICLDRMLGPW